jgi:hypothetical protein
MALTFPSNPNVGDTVTGEYGEVYTWDGTKWTITVSEGGGGIELGPTPPASPALGALWWDTIGAQLYIWDGEQWVITVNPPSGGGGDAADLISTDADNALTVGSDDLLYVPESGGGPVTGPIIGVTDGSSAQPGMVGEVISTNAQNFSLVSDVETTVATLNLPAGDWQLSGSFLVSCSLTTFLSIRCRVSMDSTAQWWNLSFASPASGGPAAGTGLLTYSFWMPATPLLTAVPVVLTMFVTCNTIDGSVSMMGPLNGLPSRLYARRMR